MLANLFRVLWILQAYVKLVQLNRVSLQQMLIPDTDDIVTCSILAGVRSTRGSNKKRKRAYIVTNIVIAIFTNIMSVRDFIR